MSGEMKGMEQLKEAANRFEQWLNAQVERMSGLSQGRGARMLGGVLGVPATLVLIVAAWLEPAAEGFGTHRQLGLAGCTVLTLTGWPCPMCGMTTTFALMAEGRLLEALHNQPFGVVLFSGTVLVSVLGMFDLATGRGLIAGLMRRLGPWEQKIATGLLIGLIGGWLWKSALMHPHIFGISS